MISAITNTPDFGPEPGISQPDPVDSTANTFAAFLDQLSKDIDVSKEDTGKMIEDLTAWMLNPPPTPQVAPQPAAPGVFGPSEEYEKRLIFSEEKMQEGLLG